MLMQTDYSNDLILPFDDVNYTLADENIKEWNGKAFEIDGTGRLQIVNTGGTSAAEGGMGSSSEAGKEKGDLEHPLTGEKGGKPTADSDNGWDPVKENIDEATAKRDNDE